MLDIKNILSKAKNIAVVGYSDSSLRDSNHISDFLSRMGYNVFGVNPRLAGRSFGKINCFDSVTEIPEPIDIVDVFVASSRVSKIVADVLKLKILPGCFWTQLGVYINENSRKLLENKNIIVVENRCIYIEHTKYFT
ncbi:MAG: CoA-binding protein [Ignavibacteria bacterium]